MSDNNELTLKPIGTTGTQKTAIYALLLFKKYTKKSHLEIISQINKGKLKRRQLEKTISNYYIWLMNEQALSKRLLIT